ncbi:MAG TPA: hypothetical protein VGE36_21260 [Roseateles sp.]
MRDEDALLSLLLELDQGEGVALARLAKRLDQRVSVLLRLGTGLSDAVVGGLPGPGWLRMACDDAGRWTAHLTPIGREAARQRIAAP